MFSDSHGRAKLDKCLLQCVEKEWSSQFHVLLRSQHRSAEQSEVDAVPACTCVFERERDRQRIVRFNMDKEVILRDLNEAIAACNLLK